MSNMVVRTNTMALNSHRNLGLVNNQQARSSARLSSGFRINSAADDAAGLGISEKMRAQIRGLNQASRNAQDGISLIQTAEGAINTINEMVTRIRELVIQAANDTNVHDADQAHMSDRVRIQDEINQLVEEINETANRTEFNTRTLLNGDLGFTNTSLTITLVGDAITAMSGAGLDAANEAAAMARINTALTSMFASRDGSTAAEWAESFGLDSTVWTLQALLDANVNTANFDTAAMAARQELVATLNAVDISDLTYPNNSLWFQIGANVGQGITVTINSVNAERLGLMIDGEVSISVLDADGENIQNKVSGLDRALAMATAERSRMGAVQNRLEFTIQNLDIASENLSAAESRIRDADMALEMMRLTQANVLQQAATVMLAQANQAPQSILQLLG